MLFSAVADLSKRKAAGAIVLPFWEKGRGAKAAASLGPLAKMVKPALDSGDFVGKAGQTLLLYVDGGNEPRIILLGLGKESSQTVDSLRESVSAIPKLCQDKGLLEINFVLPQVSELRAVSVDECLKGIAEGILLTNYVWETIGTTPEETVLLQSVCLVGILPKRLNGVKHAEHVAQGVYMARDLVNQSADIVTPQHLVGVARSMARKFETIKTTVFDRAKIEKEGLGLLAAVARASAVEPAFIQIKYRGNARSKDHTVLVGKGITFDTGGLNLKSSSGMVSMRDDMGGAATVLATMQTIAKLKLKCNVTAVVPTTENAIDAKSFKLGDVYTAYEGSTVEVVDTDAEGRLVLADAIAYSCKHLKPSRIIDFATLTGAVVVALGERIAGLYSNNDKLSDALLLASKSSAENLHRMPLYRPYRKLLDSDRADLKNSGGRAGSSILGALFIEHFLSAVPWAHLDIGGTGFSTRESGYWPKNGVGYGVRLMVDFFENFSV